MIVSVLGRVSDVDDYQSEKQGRHVWRIAVASGATMLNVEVEEGHTFEVDDFVVVLGRARAFNRDITVNGALVRSASAEDMAFFREGSRLVRSQEQSAGGAVTVEKPKAVEKSLPKGEA